MTVTNKRYNIRHFKIPDFRYVSLVKQYYVYQEVMGPFYVSVIRSVNSCVMPCITVTLRLSSNANSSIYSESVNLLSMGAEKEYNKIVKDLHEVYERYITSVLLEEIT